MTRAVTEANRDDCAHFSGGRDPFAEGDAGTYARAISEPVAPDVRRQLCGSGESPTSPPWVTSVAFSSSPILDLTLYLRRACQALKAPRS